MKTRNRSILLCLLLALLLALTASAQSVGEVYYPRLIDNADLLTADEESALLARLDKESESAQMDFVIVTVWSFDGKSAQDYADDFYDEHGYGYGTNRDGLLLLLGMESREWYISTCGRAIERFSDDTLDAIGDSMLPDLADGRYAAAFDTFVDDCSYYANVSFGYDDGYGYDYDYGYDYSYDDEYTEGEAALGAGFGILPALLFGVIIAFVVVSVMKGQLKSVGMRREASDYIRQNSLQITERSDLFLYRNVTRTPRQTSNNGGGRPGSSSHSSLHRSMGGRSHGGRGGRF